MEYRTLGKSDLKVSVITFGAWAAGGWMWGGADSNQAIEAIKAAYDMGMTSIDTAAIYGQGASEEVVAKAIKEIPRDKVQILTKFGMRWDLAKGDFAMHSQKNDGSKIDIYKYAGKESVIKECEDSLKRLGTDYIDLYQQHWPDTTTPISETMEALEILQSQGKIRYGGVSNYDKAQVAEAIQSKVVVSNQIPFSMIRQDVMTETVPFCKENNISVIAYSPMQGGLLTGKMKPDHQFNEGDHRKGNRFYTAESIEKANRLLDSLRDLANSKKATLGQLVLRWTVEQPGITIALAGARNAQQSLSNVQAANIQLTAEEIDFINQQIAKYW